MTDADGHEFVDGWKLQLEFMFPWEFRRAEGAWFVAGSDTWTRRGYRNDADKFRRDVRRTIHRNMPEGTTREQVYGSGGANARADVGHIFSLENGGSNTLGNIYMQVGAKPVAGLARSRYWLRRTILALPLLFHVVLLPTTHRTNNRNSHGINLGEWDSSSRSNVWFHRLFDHNCSSSIPGVWLQSCHPKQSRRA